MGPWEQKKEVRYMEEQVYVHIFVMKPWGKNTGN